jgi:hypothetical protein
MLCEETQESLIDISSIKKMHLNFFVLNLKNLETLRKNLTNGETENLEMYGETEKKTRFWGALSRISTAIVCRISPMLDSLFLHNSISLILFSVSRFFLFNVSPFFGCIFICLSPVFYTREIDFLVFTLIDLIMIMPSRHLRCLAVSVIEHNNNNIQPPSADYNPTEDALPLRDHETGRTCTGQAVRVT